MIIKSYHLYDQIIELEAVCSCGDILKVNNTGIIDNKFFCCPACGRQFHIILEVESSIKVQELGEINNSQTNLCGDC